MMVIAMSDNLDIGDPWGSLADEDCWYRDHENDNNHSFRHVRDKWVVVCDGISSGKKVYLQDKHRGGYWTQYKNNARIFDDFQSAKKILDRFTYNNPRIERTGG